MKKIELALHRHIAALNGAFTEAGYRVTLGMGSASFRAATAGIPHYHLYSPLDDQIVAMDNDMLWVGIETAKAGKLVAVEAGRLIHAPAKQGGLNRILNDRVFGRVLPVVSRMPPVNLTGRLGYLGGAWVDPALRGQRIMSLAVKLTTAHLVRCFNVSTVFGFVRSPHLGQALEADGYGFTSAHTVDLMYLPGESAAVSLYLILTDTHVLRERWQSPPNYRLISKKKAGPERRSGKGASRP